MRGFDTKEVIKTIMNNSDILTYFEDIDYDLITLASSPKLIPTLIGGGYQYSKYGISNSSPLNLHTLEFYGDQMLSMIIVEELRSIFGLNITPDLLTNFKRNMVNNSFLIDVANSLGYCQYIDTKTKKLCADVFEALLGTLYLQYGIQNIKRITEWLFSIEIFATRFDEEVDYTYKQHIYYQMRINLPSLSGKRMLTYKNSREVFDHYLLTFPYIHVTNDNMSNMGNIGNIGIINTSNNYNINIEGDDIQGLIQLLIDAKILS